MSKIDTKTLIEEYFSLPEHQSIIRNRSHIDRREVYEYEKQIGKQLMDMNPDEIMDMIRTFGKYKVSTDGTVVAYASYKQISSLLRDLFNYYIDNYEIIKNPMYNKMLRGQAAYEKMNEGIEPLKFETIQGYIDMLYGDYPQGHYLPQYIELIILLFYCGFATPQEIVSMKKGMVDPQTKIVTLPDKKVQLSDRCYYLLDHLDDDEPVDAYIGLYYPISYHGSYIRFYMRKPKIEAFQDRSIQEVGSVLVRTMTQQLRQKHKIDINYRKIYFLGFYDYIVSKVGKEVANRIITSSRSKEDTAILKELTEEYGVWNDNTTIVKSNLLPYVR